jgi:nicotinate phosphoribosyltransferase
VDIACRGRTFVDFGARRTHGADAALKSARAAYIGGAAATSNVLAGQAYGIPLSGTMAHSYVMSFDHEIDAFRAFARDFKQTATLLIDTYDTVEGARRVVQVARELQPEGVAVRAVRLDSGDMAVLSRAVRQVLDDAGLPGIQIFASGDLDEYRIHELLASGAPIDGFGVGTQLGASADAPALGIVYKLVQDSHGPKRKLSSGKATLPGRKQVYRFDADQYDVIATEDEVVPGGRPLLQEVMRGGRRLARLEPLSAPRERRRAAVSGLPETIRGLARAGEPYPVRLSAGLEGLVKSARPG